MSVSAKLIAVSAMVLTYIVDSRATNIGAVNVEDYGPFGHKVLAIVIVHLPLIEYVSNTLGVAGHETLMNGVWHWLGIFPCDLSGDDTSSSDDITETY